MKIPLIRKIMKVGNSNAVALPASWLRFHQQQSDQTIREVAIEVDGALRICPIFDSVKNEKKVPTNG